MKKYYLISFLASYLFPLMVSAQGGLENLGNATGLGQNTDFIDIIAKVINIFLGFLGVIVLVGIIYGGFRIMTSAGNEEQAGQGKKVVAAGLIGLVIIIASLAIANFVINNLQTATNSNF